MTKDLSNEEMMVIIDTIVRPTFKYMMKRVSNEILENKAHKDMPLNTFLSILCAALACIDANGLRWMENFYQIHTGQKMDFDKLKHAHTRNLYDQLNIILQ